jgi:hypothetical protein
MFYTVPGFLAVVDSNSTHGVYRVPGFLSSRRNRVPTPHPLTRKRVLLPLFGSKGGHTHLRGWRWGSQLRRRDTLLLCYVYFNPSAIRLLPPCTANPLSATCLSFSVFMCSRSHNYPWFDPSILRHSGI